MKIRVLGCFGSRLPGRFTSGLLIDQHLLLDAGTIDYSMPLEEQLQIDDILLTHAHLDHIVDLAFLADNVMSQRQTPIRIWAPEPVLNALCQHLFNDFVWPDFTKIPTAESPIVSLNSLPENGRLKSAVTRSIIPRRTTRSIRSVTASVLNVGVFLFWRYIDDRAALGDGRKLC